MHAEEPVLDLPAALECLDAVCANLIALANSRGGEDNTTVMVVRCKPTA